jgi:hypothetical protein
MAGRHGYTREVMRYFLVFSLISLISIRALAEPIPVKKPEGVVHGFLALRSLEGKLLADGDLVQTPRKGGISSRLTFRFRDGSLHDEEVVFKQDKVFELERYHLVQKGPSFPRYLDATLDRNGNKFVVHHRDEKKDEIEVKEGTLEIPPDLYNGMFFTLLKNLDGSAGKTIITMAAFTPEPRVVNVEITSQGEESFSIADVSRKAVHYLLDLEITGLTGVLADLLGKDPKPIHTWMVAGPAPTFVRYRGPLFQQGPEWVIELASPEWPTDDKD